MLKKYGINTILLGVVIVLLVLVLIKTSPDYVVAQGDGGAAAKHVFAVVGSRYNNREPFYLVDTRQEVIMVYEYGVQGDGLGLASARSYKYDKLLEQYGRSSFGPKVDKIKKEIGKVIR
ncbi:aspartyl/asparaginyl-tRNA synthetase [Candidatus Scalindua japonica]|uniref:Aspartyl/asparaginyl-tRNA synthetase n=1 Tax=Candidatus Scalindua japonica TaxID=1284222 RepID=A0A286TZW5_9BACT|nr:hypothetical protein [Candidatus Scalindua japonica]GAX61408.1 aspartyl/asparaginyl-tRNA synthetase [Candidatus Scalindua japonica]